MKEKDLIMLLALKLWFLDPFYTENRKNYRRIFKGTNSKYSARV
jgi:hypothetical protein